MVKLVLLSILAGTIAVPAWAARDRDPVRGLRKALLAMSLFAVLYWIGVMWAGRSLG